MGFVSYLSYKAESAGRMLVKVPAKDTTQDCSVCGNKNKKHVELSDRIFICLDCKIKLNRDYNASRNVKIRALALLAGREPASMHAEPKPILWRKPKQVQTLKREAPCGRLG